MMAKILAMMMMTNIKMVPRRKERDDVEIVVESEKEKENNQKKLGLLVLGATLGATAGSGRCTFIGRMLVLVQSGVQRNSFQAFCRRTVLP